MPDVVYRHKIWQRGSNNSIMGLCGGCRLPTTLRDNATKKHYAAAYAKPVECILDPDIGVEFVYADNSRLQLAHHEMMAQGRMVEEALRDVRDSEENLAYYMESKGLLVAVAFQYPFVSSSTPTTRHISNTRLRIAWHWSCTPSS